MALETDIDTKPYDEIAPQYDTLLERTSWIRSAFQQLVLETVPPESILLDFGCGTGTDARFYARRGHRVLAYDSSPGMMARLIAGSADAIESGGILPHCGDYASFLAWATGQPCPQAIVSDYAVINHFRDISTLFADFAHRLAPGGWVIISVLKPFYWRELWSPVWWKLYLCSVRTGFVQHPENRPAVYRHHIRRIVRAAQPDFLCVGKASAGFFLRRPFPGRTWQNPHTFAERQERRYWRRFPFRNCGLFLFLIFRRRA
jgi:SAM-dependent methyltransferase